MRHFVILLGLDAAATALLALSALAGAGATPLWEPTTLTQPGKYVVTRNITSTSGPVLVIDANDVVVDFNGFTLTSPNEVIQIGSGAVSETENVTLENGVLRGSEGILILGASLEGLTVRRTHIIANSSAIEGSFPSMPFLEGAVIERNRIHSTGRGISLIDGCDGCRVASNTIQATNDGIEIRSNYGKIVGNRVTGGGSIFVNGRTTEVSRNTISGSTGNYCLLLIGSNVSSDGGSVIGNHVSDCVQDGIVLDRVSGRIVRENAADGCGGAGMFFTASSGAFAEHNNIVENTLTGNDIGLHFGVNSRDNVYRGNLARSNAVGLEDLGTGNTSNGDNYMPNKM